ncbi:RNA-directed DNA polymerase, eukaryota, reverse transcriptase zinc-binding domain protein [Tanacetum coccineum]
MYVNELRYNLRRMWSKFGFKDIVDCNNGVFFMKFHHEDGLNQVVNSGPWMVNRKPLVVQNWSVDLNLDNTELDRIPLWVKLCNVPLKTWTVNGISALASRLGKPLVMDSVTANKCKQGIGMVRYARVLIEVSAKKTLANDVEIVYKNAEGMVQCKKTDKVEYDWKPPMRSECGVANPQVSKVSNNSKTMYQAKTKEVKSLVKTPNKTPEKEAGKNEKERLDSQEKSEELVDKGKKANTKVENNVETEDVLHEIGCIAKCMEENEGLVYMARQSVLVKVESRDGKLRLYGTFIYASNSGLERKDLWRDLEIYKRIVGQEPWFLSGDLNVTLTPKEHSIGSSAMSSDMKDFQRCVNIIEVEDINSSVLFYTWTKNLHKTKNGGQTRILKKLDIVMGNKDFSNGFCQSYAMFLPYIISDHCPSILVIPNGVQRKKKPFKFAKFITDKEEFKALVSQYGGGMDDGYRV